MKKRTALVSGANRGIGLAIARRLAELGHSVLLGSREPSAGEAAAAPLAKLGLDVVRFIWISIIRGRLRRP